VNTEPNDIIALGAIQAGIKKFDKIQKMTQIEPEELNSSSRKKWIIRKKNRNYNH